VTRLSGRLAPIRAAAAAAVMWLGVGMTGDDDDGGSLDSIGSRHPSANTSQCCRSALLFRISGETAGGSRLTPGAKAIKRDAPPPRISWEWAHGPANKSAVQRRTKSGEQNSERFSW